MNKVTDFPGQYTDRVESLGTSTARMEDLESEPHEATHVSAPTVQKRQKSKVILYIV